MKTVFILIFIATMPGLAQSTFTLKFKARHRIDSVSFSPIGEQVANKTPFKKELEFKLNATAPDLYDIIYSIERKNYKNQIWLDAGRVTVVLDIKNELLAVDTILGSPLYYETKKYKSSQPDSTQTVLFAGYMMQNFNNHLETPFCLGILKEMAVRAPHTTAMTLTLKSMQASVGFKLQNHTLYKMANQVLEDRIKDLPLINLQKHLYLNTAKNEVVIARTDSQYRLIDMWYTGCSPCIQQHGTLKHYQSKLKSNGIEIIAISNDRSFTYWENYVRTEQYSWSNYMVKNKDANLIHDLGVFIFPTYLLVDTNNRIIESFNSISQVLAYFKISQSD